MIFRRIFSVVCSASALTCMGAAMLASSLICGYAYGGTAMCVNSQCTTFSNMCAKRSCVACLCSKGAAKCICS